MLSAGVLLQDPRRRVFASLLASSLLHLLFIVLLFGSFAWHSGITPARIIEIKIGDISEFGLPPAEEENATPPPQDAVPVPDHNIQATNPPEEISNKPAIKTAAPKPAIQLSEETTREDVGRILKDLKKQYNSTERKNSDSPVAISAPGNPEGLGDDEIERYEQIISIWCQKFKKTPAELPEGETFDVLVRIRIDRNGRVVKSSIEQSSKIKAIDSAALTMVRDASPLPKVPDNYAGEAFEFLLPVTYSR